MVREHSGSVNRRDILKAAGIGTGSVMVAGCMGGGGDDGTWTLGTSDEGSSSYRVGSTLAQYLNSEGYLENIELEPIVTQGTGASYRMLDQGELEMSGTGNHLLENSPDEGGYSEQPLENFDSVRMMRAYMILNIFPVVTADSEMETWGDMAGQTFGISPAGAGHRGIIESLVDQRVGMNNIDARYMSYADMPASVRDGTLDGVMGYVVNGTTAPSLMQELDATAEWRPLSMGDELRQSLESELPHTSHEQISGEGFSEAYDGTVDTFVLTFLYVVHDDADSDIVYNITKHSFEQGDALVERDGVMGLFPDPDRSFGSLHTKVPVHQGTYDYLQEEGLWSEYDLTPPPGSS